MDKVMKKRTVIFIVISLYMWLLIVVALFLQHRFLSSVNYWVPLGVGCVLSGISKIHFFYRLPFEYIKSNKLKWALVINPGITLFSAGCGILMTGLPENDVVFGLLLFFVILTALSFLIGFVLNIICFRDFLSETLYGTKEA